LKIDQSSIKPIYVQISEGIEDDILNGLLTENEKSYSQYQIADMFNVNPATAAKGIHLLVEEGILFKKRGIGMHVSIGAKDIISKKRNEYFFTSLLRDVLIEAEKLGISKEEIKNRIDRYKGGAYK